MLTLRCSSPQPVIKAVVTDLVHSLSAGLGDLTVYARALGSLALNLAIRIPIVAQEALLPLTNALSSENSEIVSAAADAIAILCDRWLDVRVRNKFKVAGVIMPLISALWLPDNRAQASACAALASVARESDIRALLTQHRGVEHIARALRCTTSFKLQAAAADCLAAGECLCSDLFCVVNENRVRAPCRTMQSLKTGRGCVQVCHWLEAASGCLELID